MFKPEEIIFAPTADCNLACPHCRVTRIPDRLEARDAVAFMKSCRAAGLELMHSSGLTYNPVTRRYRLSDDTDVNYMLAARKPAIPA